MSDGDKLYLLLLLLSLGWNVTSRELKSFHIAQYLGAMSGYDVRNYCLFLLCEQ